MDQAATTALPGYDLYIDFTIVNHTKVELMIRNGVLTQPGAKFYWGMIFYPISTQTLTIYRVQQRRRLRF